MEVPKIADYESKIGHYSLNLNSINAKIAYILHQLSSDPTLIVYILHNALSIWNNYYELARRPYLYFTNYRANNCQVKYSLNTIILRICDACAGL